MSWAGLPTMKDFRCRETILLVAILVAVLLAASAGPIAAVAVIPSLGFWPQIVGNWSTGRNKSLDFHINAYREDTWSTTITKDSISSDCLSDLDNGTQDFCPAGGYPVIRSWLDNFQRIAGNPPTACDGCLNLTMTDFTIFGVFAFFARFVITASFYDPSESTTYVASTPQYEVATDTMHFWESTVSPIMRSLPKTPIVRATDSWSTQGPLKPVVQLQCNSSFYDSSVLLEFPHSGLRTPPFQDTTTNIYQNGNFTANATTIGDQDILKKRLTWVDLGQQNPAASVVPSIGAALFFPGCHAHHERRETPTGMVTCSVDVRWLPNTLGVSPSTRPLQFSNVVLDLHSNPLGLINSLKGTADDHLSDSAINITTGWAAVPNVPINPSMTMMESLYYGYVSCVQTPEALGPSCYNYNQSYYLPYFYSNYTQALCAACVADDVSRIDVLKDKPRVVLDADYPSTFPGRPDLTGPATAGMTRLNVEVLRYGYSYGVRSVTGWIALVVPIIHGTMALGAMAVLVFDRKLSTAWGSLGKLLVLALNSGSPPELRNTGAGVSRLDTGRTATAVQVVDSDGGAARFRVGVRRWQDGRCVRCPESGEEVCLGWICRRILRGRPEGYPGQTSSKSPNPRPE
ncbi:hypothetical protein BJ546DRAFT_161069 [Cryomyces antarcticus]